ncbi:MAG: acyl-CoA dehydrogenase [Longimicrobiales bacterium]
MPSIRLDPELLPFAPLIYVAWADGVLSDAEIAEIRRRIREEAELGDAARRALDRWLNPARPPAPSELAALLASLRRAARRLPADARGSLASLGVALAADGDAAISPAVRRAVTALERALGVVPSEAVRGMLAESTAPPGTDTAETPPRIDTARLRALLDADHLELRDQVLELLATPAFRLRHGLPVDEHRAVVMDWLRWLAERGWGALGYPPEYGGAGDIGKAIAVFETLAFHDQSLVVKFGVNFGLFGGSILHLGTAHHHERWLSAVGTLALPGCYAMTEIAHGSNVRELETLARYLTAEREFEIHTPHDDARKDWIGNAALHARMATVFAQLEVAGEHHGVHALVVPLRDASGATLPGIVIEDNGLKQGLNGVDNGRIRFDRVRVPRDHLLDRFGTVNAAGQYESSIPSDGRRFFTMLGTLIAGRISIATAAISASKLGLTIALRYTERRRQFGPEGGPEIPVLDYLAQQRRLLPRLATTYALHFAARDLVRRYAALQPGDDVPREIEVLAAGIKAYASEHTAAGLRDCRQACGGRGYAADARFGALLADTDVYTTFEGANLVLWQLVAKGLLTELREEFGELRLWAAVKYFGRQAAGAVAERNPIAVRRTDPEHLRDSEFQQAALEYREQHLRVTAARRLKRRIDDGMDSFDALNDVQDHVIALAQAHIERVLHDCFTDGVETVRRELGADDVATTSLMALRALFGLACIEADRGWFLESGFLESPKSKAIRAEVNTLCRELRPHAAALANAFGVPDALVGSAPF